jgi:hypothetical protein
MFRPTAVCGHDAKFQNDEPAGREQVCASAQIEGRRHAFAVGPRARRGQYRFRDVDADAGRDSSEPAGDRHRRASRPAANVEQLIGTKGNSCADRETTITSLCMASAKPAS